MIIEQDVAGDEPLVDHVCNAGERLALYQHSVEHCLGDAGANRAFSILEHIRGDAQVAKEDGRSVHPGDGLDAIHQCEIIVHEVTGDYRASHLSFRIQHRRTGDLCQASATLPRVEEFGVRLGCPLHGDGCPLCKSDLFQQFCVDNLGGHPALLIGQDLGQNGKIDPVACGRHFLPHVIDQFVGEDQVALRVHDQEKIRAGRIDGVKLVVHLLLEGTLHGKIIGLDSIDLLSQPRFIRQARGGTSELDQAPFVERYGQLHIAVDPLILRPLCVVVHDGGRGPDLDDECDDGDQRKGDEEDVLQAVEDGTQLQLHDGAPWTHCSRRRLCNLRLYHICTTSGIHARRRHRA